MYRSTTLFYNETGCTYDIRRAERSSTFPKIMAWPSLQNIRSRCQRFKIQRRNNGICFHYFYQINFGEKLIAFYETEVGV